MDYSVNSVFTSSGAEREDNPPKNFPIGVLLAEVITILLIFFYLTISIGTEI